MPGDLGGIDLSDFVLGRGTVVMFGNGKSYGFIAPETGGPDIFVHKRNVRRDAKGRHGSMSQGRPRL